MTTVDRSPPNPLLVFAEGVDTNRVADEIASSTQKRHRQAALPYEALFSGRMRTPETFSSNSEFLERFLAVMHDNAFVDISDFEIIERRQRWSRPLITVKKALWNLLRFYTYRLWSQQNEINGFLLAALEGMHTANKERDAHWETRLAHVEKELADAKATFARLPSQQDDERIR